MKLRTEQGELDLPQDFVITLTKTNPMLSEEGDSSYPVTLPPTENNKALTGHRQRLDRHAVPTNKINAILTAGAFEKHGKLIIDSASRKEGITAVFASDNSDLYLQAKDKSLKEIMSIWHYYFIDHDAALAEMQSRMNSFYDSDYYVCPVAVSPYTDEDGNTVYQYNNEVDSNGNLVYEARTVMEDGELVSVPKGYGIAPFVPICDLLSKLFQSFGYYVDENMFESSPTLRKVVLLHNCSDAVLTNEIEYKDLVPSCTLSEFLTWLEAKFHAVVLADSSSKTVRIVSAEDMLRGADENLTDLVIDEPALQYSPTSRVVLKPTCTIEGSKPITETANALAEKYSSIKVLTEAQFETLSQAGTPLLGQVMLRKATGVYYEQCLDLKNRRAAFRAVGTNYFAYDRANSEEEETYQQQDSCPLMICEEGRKIAPYIGERTHRHTHYKGKEENDSQDIMIAQVSRNVNYGFRATATTQSTIPWKTGTNVANLGLELTNEGLYQRFWQRYNTMLLNGKVTVSVKLAPGTAVLQRLDMGYPKLIGNRGLLPVRATTSIGKKVGETEMELILLDNWENQTVDSAVEIPQGDDLDWRYDIQSDLDTAARACVPTASSAEALAAEFAQDLVWVGHPKALGETKTVTALCRLLVRWTNDQRAYSQEWYDDVTVTINLSCG